MRGAFITFEGIEGVGKSTGLDHVRACLAAEDIAVIATREPGGTALGERIRHWILRGKHGPLAAETETLLMFAARAVHLDEVVRPALAAGRWVLCDRFSDATAAYQGGGRGASAAWIESLRATVHADLEPDLTLLLDAPVEVGLARIRSRAPDHFEREDRAFFRRVRETYLELAQRAPNRIRIIDAQPPLPDVKTCLSRRITAFVREFARNG